MARGGVASQNRFPLNSMDCQMPHTLTSSRLTMHHAQYSDCSLIQEVDFPSIRSIRAHSFLNSHIASCVSVCSFPHPLHVRLFVCPLASLLVCSFARSFVRPTRCVTPKARVICASMCLCHLFSLCHLCHLRYPCCLHHSCMFQLLMSFGERSPCLCHSC